MTQSWNVRLVQKRTHPIFEEKKFPKGKPNPSGNYSWMVHPRIKMKFIPRQ
jgi:hypothetical protein